MASVFLAACSNGQMYTTQIQHSLPYQIRFRDLWYLTVALVVPQPLLRGNLIYLEVEHSVLLAEHCNYRLTICINAALEQTLACRRAHLEFHLTVETNIRSVTALPH